MDMSAMNVNDIADHPDFNPDDSAAMAQLFERYKVQLHKSYPTPEANAKAYDEFQKNVRKVRQHNSEHKQGQHSYTMGINQFTDGTPAFCGLAPRPAAGTTPAAGALNMSTMDLNDIADHPAFNPDDSAAMAQLFERYKVQLHKSYPTPEANAQAYAEFQKNVRMVRQHNAEHKQGQHSYTMGINQFTDGTPVSCGLVPPPDAAAPGAGTEPHQQHHGHHHHHHKHHAQHQEQHQGQHQDKP